MHSQSIKTNLKIALIPVLGFLLLYLVLRGRIGSEESPIDPLVTVTSDTTASSNRTQDQEKPLTSAQSDWPEFQLNDLQNADPFDRRMIFPDLSAITSSDQSNTLVGSNNQSSVGALPTIKVQAVFQSPSGITALVDNRVLHIGDRLADGSEVIGITPEQLVLAKPNIH